MNLEQQLTDLVREYAPDAEVWVESTVGPDGYVLTIHVRAGHELTIPVTRREMVAAPDFGVLCREKLVRLLDGLDRVA
ncbi:MAG: hypothetical protein LC798_20715 [Chloroflexi bacterium]|nr:hypothetical protein [Chloroflexota bacterium]